MDDEIELLGELLDDELAGYEDEVGAIRVPSSFRRPRSRRRGSTRLLRRKLAYANKLMPAIPGTPSPGARRFPLGIGQHIFANGGATSFQFLVNPQRPFKGYRLVADVRRSAAALAELVTLTQFNIGSNNQLVGTASLPLEAFAPDGVDVGLKLDPATPGIDIAITVGISAAPGVGETVAVSLMLVGDTIG